jgi:CBS domain-containing protein
MEPADPDAVARCRQRRSVATYGGLFDLAEHAPRVTAADATPIAFGADSTTRWVAIVDEYDRPIGLIDRHGDAHPPLIVLPAERLSDVARRMASRPARERYTPVVLCDEHARLLGLVTLERVLGRLADAIDSTALP